MFNEVFKVMWGSKNTEKPFRQIFEDLSTIRSVCRENVPILCLSTVDFDLLNYKFEEQNNLLET